MSGNWIQTICEDSLLRRGRIKVTVISLTNRNFNMSKRMCSCTIPNMIILPSSIQNETKKSIISFRWIICHRTANFKETNETKSDVVYFHRSSFSLDVGWRWWWCQCVDWIVFLSVMAAFSSGINWLFLSEFHVNIPIIINWILLEASERRCIIGQKNRLVWINFFSERQREEN